MPAAAGTHLSATGGAPRAPAALIDEPIDIIANPAHENSPDGILVIHWLTDMGKTLYELLREFLWHISIHVRSHRLA